MESAFKDCKFQVGDIVQLICGLGFSAARMQVVNRLVVEIATHTGDRAFDRQYRCVTENGDILIFQESLICLAPKEEILR